MPSAKIIRFARLSRHRQYLLAEALTVLAAASAAVRFLPFRKAIAIGSRRLSGPVPGNRSEILHEARWSIEAAAAAAPWRAVCLQKGLALQWMLRRRGIDALFHYGIAKEEHAGLEAHVWVAVDDRMVIGGEIAERFCSVAIVSTAWICNDGGMTDSYSYSLFGLNIQSEIHLPELFPVEPNVATRRLCTPWNSGGRLFDRGRTESDRRRRPAPD